MVYKLKPLELGLEFEDRDYELGDTINIQVSLTPNGDVNLRGGRVDLVCEERYSQRGATLISARSILATRSRSSVAPGTRNVATDRKERLVHSTVSLLEAGRLRGGAPTIRAARLLVQPTPPPHFEEAMALQGDAQSSWTFKWRLVASVNVARGRDQKRQRQVRVKLPLAPVEGRVGTKPRMSKPKRRTGSSG